MEDRYKNTFDNILEPIRAWGYNALLCQLRTAECKDPYNGDNGLGLGGVFQHISCYSLPIMTPLLGYREGFIHYSEFGNNNYAISFGFTGCAMAKFTLGGHTYFCHIYTSGDAVYDCKAAWNKFLQDNSSKITDLVIFKPFTPRIYTMYSNNLSVLGIIAKDGSCYSALMDKSSLTIIPPVAGVAPLYRSYGAINLDEAKEATSYRYQFKNK